MTSIQTKVIDSKVYYSKLLQRYARFLIRNEEEATKLVKYVLDNGSINDYTTICKRMRTLLKTDVLNHCYYWKYSQIFDRPPVTLQK